MKRILATTIAALGAALLPAAADELTSFRICEDQRVIHTSDGAEAGRVEYIMVEPSTFRVVSAVVHGGVVADKYIAVPISVMRFGTSNEITLTSITREKLVAAPTFEVSHLRAGATIDMGLVERSYTHFGVNASEIRTSSTTRTESGRNSRLEGGANINSTERTTTSDPNADRNRNGQNANDRSAAERDALRSTREPNSNQPNQPNSTDKRNSGPNSSETNRTPNNPNRNSPDASQPDNKNFDRDPLHNGSNNTSSPGQNNTSPGKSGSTPGQSDTAPGKSGSTPGQSDTTPGKSGNTPGQSDTTPGKSGSTPGQSDTAPGKSGNTPGQSDTAPGKTKRSNQGTTEDEEASKASKRSGKSEKSEKSESDESSSSKSSKRSGQGEADKDESTKNKKRE